MSPLRGLLATLLLGSACALAACAPAGRNAASDACTAALESDLAGCDDTYRACTAGCAGATSCLERCEVMGCPCVLAAIDDGRICYDTAADPRRAGQAECLLGCQDRYCTCIQCTAPGCASGCGDALADCSALC